MSTHDDIAPNDWPCGKVGYVALLGRPNTGKSTFLNTVLDVHLAAVSAKPQTTRRPLLGIFVDKESQILFIDAPGVHEPRHALGKSMERTIARRLADADLIVCMADATRIPGEEDQMVAERAAAAGKTVLLAINKTDTATPGQSKQIRDFYRGFLPEARSFDVAAIRRNTLDELLAGIKSALPQGPFLYPADTLTDTFERHIGAELIREACLEMLHEEVPHGVAVTIEEWKESGENCLVQATLHVNQKRHKSIVIGHDGTMIKRLRGAAKKKLEELHGGRVKLKLWVKADPNWQRNSAKLKEFGLWT